MAITVSAASEYSSGSNQAAAIEASRTNAISAAAFVAPGQDLVMRHRCRLRSRGADFGEQQLKIAFLAHTGDVGDRVVAARAMTKSSPASTGARRSDRWVFASEIFTVVVIYSNLSTWLEAPKQRPRKGLSISLIKRN
ncbi:hypothetical protein [Rhizobium tumorigenes]|uniref:hypothetical protein n=1 Tax=Rhizobium tumorigenes TaxID=2041385 RepID=UPI003BF9478C